MVLEGGEPVVEEEEEAEEAKWNVDVDELLERLLLAIEELHFHVKAEAALAEQLRTYEYRSARTLGQLREIVHAFADDAMSLADAAVADVASAVALAHSDPNRRRARARQELTQPRSPVRSGGFNPHLGARRGAAGRV
jgi:hypothetical protein